jgi:hypothetical protein
LDNRGRLLELDCHAWQRVDTRPTLDAIPGLSIGATANHALAQLALTPFLLPAALR